VPTETDKAGGRPSGHRRALSNSSSSSSVCLGGL
jgi:hypothetical protein